MSSGLYGVISYSKTLNNYIRWIACNANRYDLKTSVVAENNVDTSRVVLLREW